MTPTGFRDSAEQLAGLEVQVPPLHCESATVRTARVGR